MISFEYFVFFDVRKRQNCGGIKAFNALNGINGLSAAANS